MQLNPISGGQPSWAKGLDVRGRARADGAAGVPEADCTALSALERDIAARQDLARGALEAERASLKAEAERGLRRLKPAARDLSGALASARLALSQVEGRAAPESAAAVERTQRRRDDLEGFRRAHGLRRDAVYPDSTLLQSGLLFCAALFESLFSATLFAQEAEQGLLGGAAIAVGLSAANVTLGFLAGFLGLRYLQSARRWPRAFGAGAFAGMLGLAGLLNLFAARWRESLATDGAIPDPFAPSLDLFGFTSPQAVVLLMLGAGVWVFAALKGYSGFDDPYPDYGKMHRAYRDAAQALKDLRGDVREALEDPAAQAQAAIEADLGAMRSGVQALRTAYDDAASAMDAIDARLRALDDNAAALIQLYRKENVAARQSPAPAYFGEPPPSAPAPADALLAAGQILQSAQEELARAQREAADALAALQADMEAISARLDGRGSDARKAA